ncbi:MAG: flavin reductase [Lachnospiraceae bacterium]|jgi:flavin reductase (DIM6/NTAB) family NADH-FMN oxidoreductase RutF/rubredoxin|nr:flavin reductase [Lachnospiraceae bacterium]
MDLTALFKLSYGLYIISTKDGDKKAGCLVNTLTQVTSSPPRLIVAINKENETAKVVKDSGKLAATPLVKSAPMELIGQFGFQSSKEVDKFTGYTIKEDKYGIPYVTQHTAAVLSMYVMDTIDAGSHYVFLCELTEAIKLSDEEVMTYAYYHQVKGGKTPPKASSYQAADDSVPAIESAAASEKPKKGYKCKICGYIYEGDEIPDDYICPICKKPREFFIPIE